MSVDKLVDSTQLDADLTSVANAIRTKGGTSAQLAFPADFVTAIGAISGGGGGTPFAAGTVTLTTASANIYVSTTFQPQHAVIYAHNSDMPTDNTWKTMASLFFDSQTDGVRIMRYGASNWNQAHFAASNFSYNSETEKFKFATADNSYKFAANVQYTWYAWRDS